jgi:hypothetical protein
MINKEFMKEFVKYLPIVGAVIVFFGFLKLQFYYSYFDIDIIYYLEFSEIITLFLGDISTIILSLFVMMSYLLIVGKIADKMTVKSNDDSALEVVKAEKMNDEKETIKKGNSNRIGMIIGTSGGVIISIIISSIMLTSYHNNNNSNEFLFWFMNIFGSLFILSLLVIIIDVTIKEAKNKDRIYNYAGLLGLVGIVFFLVFNMAKKAHYEVLNFEKQVELSLADGRKICTDVNFKFIGKTYGFYFFSDIESKENLIIPLNDVVSYKEVKNIDCRCNCSEFK